MATGTLPNSSAPAPARSNGHSVVGYDQFIESQLRKTRAQVKWVDLTSALMTLAIAGLVYLLLVALADHWVFSAGLGFWGRLVCLTGLLGGGLAYGIMVLAPLVFKRINPVYAAHAIEETRPSLKNSLVNFLLLRSSRAGVSEAVYQAVEQQAAARLSQVHVDAAIDRSRLVRMFLVLLGVVTLCAAYTIFSPKNPIQTVGRVMFPWADIAVPTRVTITEVLPGDVSKFHDEYLEVQALVQGVDADDPVTLFYSTADGQTVDHAIGMHKPEGSFKYRAVLPEGGAGLKQNVTYFVSAGDASTRPYRVTVLPAPTIVVDRAELAFPKYTGLEPMLQQQGDLKAIEGTRVTLHAKANQEIAKAHVDLDCKGNRNRSLQVTGDEGQVTIPLRFQADGRAPEFTSYQIRFTNKDGHENPQPIRYRVEVLRDLPPEVKLESPKEPHIELPLNGSLEFKVWARDADYALSQVSVVAERVDRGGDVLFAERLLAEPSTDEFTGTYTLRPEKLKLKVGDAIRVWGEARDNRQPDDDQPPVPNRSETDKVKVTIVAPEQQDPNQQQPKQGDANPNQQPQQGNNQKQPNQGANQGQKQDQQPQDGQKQEGQKQDGQKQDGQKQDGQKQDGQQGQGEPQEGQGEGQNQQQGEGQGQKQGDSGQQGAQERIDPVANPGDAIDKINEQLQQKKNQDPNQNQQGNQPQGDQQQDQQQQGNQPNQQKKPQEQQGQNNSGGGQQPQQGSQQGQQNQGQQNQGQPQNQQQQGAGQQPQPMGDQGKPTDTAQQKPMQGGDQRAGGDPSEGAQQTGGNNTQGANGQATSPNEQAAQPMGPGDKPAGNQKPAQGNQEPGKNGKPTDERPMTDPAVDPMQKAPGGDPQAAGRQARSGDNGPDNNPAQPKPAKGDGSEVKGTGTDKPREPGKVGQTEDKGGDRDNEKGDNPGAGTRSSNDNKPSPTPQEPSQPRGQKNQKSPEDPGQNDPKEPDAKSPSGSKKQSDSNGNDQGDRSGGGKEGGGQTAKNKEGTGGPGSTTASDQGKEKAPGSGDGEVSPEAGDKTQANQPTGKPDPDQRAGDGTQQKQGSSKPGDGQPGKAQQQSPKNDGQPGKNADGTPQDQNQSPGGQAGNNPTGNPSLSQTPSGADQGAENPAARRTPPPSSDPQGDAANLEYANKATDLALEHLKDQLAKEKPDQDLLDKLGWTREDMQRFVDHWETMKQQARLPGAEGDAGRKRLEEQLKSLGLRPQGSTLKSGTSQDTQRNLRETRRVVAPSDYAEQVKAYKQRLAKGQAVK